MTPAEETQFNEVVSNFVIAPYEVVTVSGRKVSSFVSGQQGSAVFFWRAPAGRVYVVNTQAPYLIRLIQQAVGAHVDGQFGDSTRIAIVNDARSRGVNFADNEPVLAPLMAYAINRALFGGIGTVGIPGSVQYPDIALATLASGRSSYLRMRDIATGRDATLAPVTLPTGQTANLPTNANVPPPVSPSPVPVAPTTRPEVVAPALRIAECLVTFLPPPASELGAPPSGFTPWSGSGNVRIVSQSTDGTNSTSALIEVRLAPGASDTLAGTVTLARYDGSSLVFNLTLPFTADRRTIVRLQGHVTPAGVTSVTELSRSSEEIPPHVPAPGPTPNGTGTEIALPGTRTEGLPGNNNALAPGPAVTYPVATPQQPAAPPQPMSTGTKVAIGVVGVAAVGGIVWYAKKQRWF